MKIQSKLALLIIVATVGMAFAAPRLNIFVQKVYQNNGDSRSGFTLNLSSSSWTTILSADANRRYAIFHATSTTVFEVCLSTVSASATTCTTTLPGRHIPTVGIVIEDYNEAPLYGRVVAGSAIVGASSTTILGETQKDSLD